MTLGILKDVQTADLIDEFSWESQKIDIQLSKLRKLFVQSLQSYDIDVSDFQNSTVVNCFRSVIPISHSFGATSANLIESEDFKV